MSETAKEMFEELKFRLYEQDEYKIVYWCGGSLSDKYHWMKITFYLHERKVGFFQDAMTQVSVKPIGMDLFRTINKQCEELLWLCPNCKKETRQRYWCEHCGYDIEEDGEDDDE